MFQISKHYFSFIGPILVFLVWGVVTGIGLVSPLFLPALDETLAKMISLLTQKGIWVDIGWTLYRTGLSFLLAAMFGVPLGLLLGFFPRVNFSFEWIIDFFRSLPILSLFPLFLLIFGIGDTSKIAIAAFHSFWIVLVSTIGGVIYSTQVRYKVIKIFGANIWQVLTNVTLREASPQIAVGLRVAFSFSLVAIVTSEMFVGTQVGLGSRIYESYLVYRVQELYATIVVTGLLGYFLNTVFAAFEKRYIHWIER